jgi:hypothetical protein
MFCCSRRLGVLRSLMGLALMGFAVTVLIGPVLAVLGVLLPFAMIGALAWVGFRVGRVLVRRIRGRRTRLVLVDSPPAPSVDHVDFRPAVGELPIVRPPSRLRALTRSTLQVAVEVGCGAILGAALAVLMDWQSGSGIEHPTLGAIIGAVVGFVVGGSRSQPDAEGASSQGKTASEAA